MLSYTNILIQGELDVLTINLELWWSSFIFTSAGIFKLVNPRGNDMSVSRSYDIFNHPILGKNQKYNNLNEKDEG